MLECPFGTKMSSILLPGQLISVLLGMRTMWRHHEEGLELMCIHWVRTCRIWQRKFKGLIMPFQRLPIPPQSVILLHHIKIWMQRSIVEVADQIKKKVDQQIEVKIRTIHQRLDAFKL